MSEQFTPGPWFPEWNESYWEINPKCSIHDVAKVNSAWEDREGTQEGNAHLMAAAPDLYAALMEAREYFDERADAEYFTDSPNPKPNEEMRLLSEIDAACAKARGENDMTTIAERAARGEAVTPDLDNPWNLVPIVDEAFAEALAGMSENRKADLLRAMLAGQTQEWAAMLEREVLDYARAQAYEIGNE